MRTMILAAVAVLCAGCGIPSPNSPRAIQINGHDYYQVGSGNANAVIDNHECKKCRAELLQLFEELAEPVK